MESTKLTHLGHAVATSYGLGSLHKQMGEHRLLAAAGEVRVDDAPDAVRIAAARHRTGGAGVQIRQQRDRFLAVPGALDGVAAKKDEAYLIESLADPNARLAEGYIATPVSPMPPMRLILKPQEFEDVKAFLMTLK